MVKVARPGHSRLRIVLALAALALAAVLFARPWGWGRPPTNAARYQTYMKERERLRQEILSSAPGLEGLRAWEAAHKELRARHGLPESEHRDEWQRWTKAKTPWDRSEGDD